MTLGERLAKLRQDKQLSQKELASNLGKKTTDIALWESDEAVPSISDLSKLSSVLEVSVDSLINDVQISEDNPNDYSQTKDEHSASDSELKSQEQKPKSKKKWFLIIVIVAIIMIGGIIALFTLNSSIPFSEDTNSIEKAASSVVKIFCYDYDGNESATGSGFIAFDNQTVVTNYHVMEEAYTCKISTDQDKTLEIESIINYSEDNDIAILRLKDPSDLDALDFGNSDIIKKGETVTAIGSPLGIKNSVSKGILSGRIMEENMDALQFTAEISPGSSGGALFNEQGKVIGVTYASYEDGQNLNLAIPINKVEELQETKILERKPESIYLFKHPYTLYLIDNKDKIEDVTFEELKADPEKWNNKIVSISGYALDLSDIGTPTYLADSYLGAFDNQGIKYTTYLDIDFELSHIIRIGIQGSFVEEIQTGDKVTVIGEFNYKKKGEEIMFQIASEHNTASVSNGVVINKTGSN